MLNIKFIRENRDLVIERLKVKNFKAENIIVEIILLDDERRKTQVDQDARQAELNTTSKEIGNLFKAGKAAEANLVKEKTILLKDEIKELTSSMQNIESKLDELLIQIPNIPHKSVPKGKGEADNLEIHSGGKIPELESNALPHWELGKKYNILDFDLGNKITGAGFPVFMGKGAKLQRSLIQFFLDEAINAGYNEVLPPLMVNEASGYGTGQLPDKEGQMYHVTADNLYLIPTSEVPVTNIYRDLIINASDFPIKNTSFTPCFRREAGSYGKDVRGLNRVHQFDKVEIVQIQHPDNSYKALDEMVKHVEGLLKKLEMPYRIMRLCGGDISFTSALTYDFEVYSAAQKKWLEVSSVSNFESFQANRLKLRFREEGTKKTRLAHTLNGSALALPRIIAALLENNQTNDGINIPEILIPYTGFDTI
ncbi:MAG: serine--tRNA ligase [Bacteroidales bacterium]|nr:serine--tRNA ligase [Bacteroidales bacterium]